jgi:thiamine pyrophosphate-dependent acetolactate synthase large subunit-like protein
VIGALIVDADAPPAAFSGVGEAWMDNTPMLVLVLQSNSTTGGPAPLESVDGSVPIAVASKLTKCTLDTATPDAIPQAAAVARDGCPAPVAVYLRRDDATSAAPSPLATGLPTPTGLEGAALHQAVADVVAALSKAKQPRLHFGLGAATCPDLAAELADLAGAVVSTTFSAKGVYPEGEKRWLWAGVGVALPPALRKIDGACDVWLILGARMGELASAHYNWPAKRLTAFHVDADPQVPPTPTTPNRPPPHTTTSPATLAPATTRTTAAALPSRQPPLSRCALVCACVSGPRRQRAQRHAARMRLPHLHGCAA